MPRRPAPVSRVKPNAELLKIARGVMLCSWASSYTKQGNCAFERFCRWAAHHDFPLTPVSEEMFLCYAAFRYCTTANSGASFRTELYNIRQAFIRFGIQIDISAKGPWLELHRMVQGWIRLRGPTYNRKPVTSEVLKRFFEFLDPNDHNDQVSRALLAVGKFGMLRCSEFTYNGDRGNAPLVGDVRLYPNASEAQFMALYFSKSKTNQTARTERVICACACPEPCAVHEVIRMLNSRQSVRPEDYLFCYDSGKPPSTNFLRGLIKKLCLLCGLRPGDYSTHSLRKGGVTDLLCRGVPDSIIQLLTRHASLESLKPYKKPTDAQLGTILSNFMNNQLSGAAKGKRQ